MKTDVQIVPPRFKQNARINQFAYLGDSIKFKCNAVGRPQPKVHWYRNGKYMNYRVIGHVEYGIKKDLLVDFCDYFLNVGIHPSRVPEECLCQWVVQHKESSNKAAEDPLFHLRALPQLRADIDLSGFLTNFTNLKSTTTTSTTNPPITTFSAVLSTTTIPSTKQQKFRPSLKIAPYFRKSEEDTRTNIVIPAGRTLKLSCKAGGQPEPQVDSGEYTCEVFNSAGSILRRFHVEVQDRIRARPILVPNVLQNRTVDVNGTVNFTCQVISDLVPHVIWIKLINLPENGSFLIWDEKEQRETLNFVDMTTLKNRVKIFHDKRSNRYTMELRNVSMSDQGLYSCVVGNTLGLSMGNATLTVNEFRSLTLPTEVPTPWPLSYTSAKFG
uniref:receptor protein-tyrosine kinase n=1 Tax=Meloidogyne floridensis TaxID=298350 RepID=A0A915NYJ1_9BILA